MGPQAYDDHLYYAWAFARFSPDDAATDDSFIGSEELPLQRKMHTWTALAVCTCLSVCYKRSHFSSGEQISHASKMISRTATSRYGSANGPSALSSRSTQHKTNRALVFFLNGPMPKKWLTRLELDGSWASNNAFYISLNNGLICIQFWNFKIENSPETDGYRAQWYALRVQAFSSRLTESLQVILRRLRQRLRDEGPESNQKHPSMCAILSNQLYAELVHKSSQLRFTSCVTYGMILFTMY